MSAWFNTPLLRTLFPRLLGRQKPPSDSEVLGAIYERAIDIAVELSEQREYAWGRTPEEIASDVVAMFVEGPVGVKYESHRSPESYFYGLVRTVTQSYDQKFRRRANQPIDAANDMADRSNTPFEIAAQRDDIRWALERLVELSPTRVDAIRTEFEVAADVAGPQPTGVKNPSAKSRALKQLRGARGDRDFKRGGRCIRRTQQVRVQ